MAQSKPITNPRDRIVVDPAGRAAAGRYPQAGAEYAVKQARQCAKAREAREAKVKSRTCWPISAVESLCAAGSDRYRSECGGSRY